MTGEGPCGSVHNSSPGRGLCCAKHRLLSSDALNFLRRQPFGLRAVKTNKRDWKFLGSPGKDQVVYLGQGEIARRTCFKVTMRKGLTGDERGRVRGIGVRTSGKKAKPYLVGGKKQNKTKRN